MTDTRCRQPPNRWWGFGQWWVDVAIKMVCQQGVVSRAMTIDWWNKWMWRLRSGRSQTWYDSYGAVYTFRWTANPSRVNDAMKTLAKARSDARHTKSSHRRSLRCPIVET